MVDEGGQSDVVSEDLRRFEAESLGLLHRFGTESSDGWASSCAADEFWSDVDMARIDDVFVAQLSEQRRTAFAI